MELQHKRIYEESENGTKSIAYITVSHGAFIDDMSKILHKQRANPKILNYNCFRNLDMNKRKQCRAVLDHSVY